MKLLFLYGAPAVGKLTVAQKLSEMTGWRLFHNHLTVDLVLSLYDFGSPGFVALREQIWWAAIRQAVTDGRTGLLFTFNPENSVPQRFIDELFAEVAARGGEVIPIELTASESEIERRLNDASRQQRRKLVDRLLYRALREAGAFATPVIPSPRLRIDTGTTSPHDAALQIARLLPPMR